MAATVTPEARANTNNSLLSHSARGLKVLFGTITFDSSYPTGGESVTFPGITTGEIGIVLIQNKGGYSFSFDKTNSKVLAYYDELSAGTDGVQIQVASSVDLSAVTADFAVFGY